MPSYKFDTLSPLDFEFLVRDLLQLHFDCHIESFKTGKDGGVDLRIAKTKDQLWIIQCKRFVETTYAKLKREIKKETAKIKKLKPKRYIFCTSLPLLPQQKDELLGLLSPYCKSTSDIFGNEDINNLLGRFPKIERQHFKLWLCSENILQQILNSEIFSRTTLDEEEIRLRISMFVPTAAVPRAEAILKKKGYCLLAGIPGIGKTTTAEILLAMHVKQGWSAVVVTNAAQAIKALSSSEKQIIYYDDFLGQTSLREKLGKNEEDDIQRLLSHCARNPKRVRFILTTREYILEQAKVIHEKLKRSSIELSRCTIRLEDYTKKIRAKILLSHLYFYGIPQPVRKYMADRSYARQIVEHRNYSPRVIETMCRRYVHEAKTPARFSKEFIALLENPTEIWESAYYDQLSDDARNLLVCFASISDLVSEVNLELAFKAFLGSDADTKIGMRFRNALKELDGNFLRSRRKLSGSEILFQYHNPSVKDFMDIVVADSSISVAITTRAHFHCQLTNNDAFLSTPKNVVADSVRRTISSPEPGFDIFQNALLPKSTQLAERICFWDLQIDKDKELKTLLPFLSRIGMKYLNGEPEYESTRNLVSLFQFVVEQLASKFSYSIKHIYSVIRSSIITTDDFMALEDFLKDLEDREREELGEVNVRSDFMEFANKQLWEASTSSDGSSEVSQLIEDVKEIAEHFEFSDEEIDALPSAQEALDEMLEREDHMADMEKDDYYFERQAERNAEMEVSDILDSLRD